MESRPVFRNVTRVLIITGTLFPLFYISLYTFLAYLFDLYIPIRKNGRRPSYQ